MTTKQKDKLANTIYMLARQLNTKLAQAQTENVDISSAHAALHVIAARIAAL